MAGLTLRRTRLNRHVRALTREQRPHREQLIQPLFVVDGLHRRESIPGLHAVFRDTPDSLLTQIEQDLEAGISKFLLFGVPDDIRERDFGYGFLCEQLRAVKERFGNELWLAADVCLCSHTTHGHCGILNDRGDGILNAPTVNELARAATEYAQAGADCVAPSDMMDGRVAAIRRSLDDAGLEQTLVMSYAAKFDSAFYGPFRHAANSTPSPDNSLTGRASYQLDPARPADALLSARRDKDEGADILMVKPGLPYLDVLRELSGTLPLPWAVYQVSGEQAAIDLLAGHELVNRDRAQLETWTAFVRAGAHAIISYAARRSVPIA